MHAPPDRSTVLPTPAGDLPLHEYRLRVGGREWSVRHTTALLSAADEARYLNEQRERMPYGVVLWPSAIALAHEILSRPGDFRGRRVLELGAGTGLPGIVAASLGAHVVQTDRQELALAVCRGNGARNGLPSIEYRVADWTAWTDDARYDWIIGSDVIYGPTMHEPLRRILASNLVPGGRALVSDPFRKISLRLLEGLEADGWRVTMSRWSVGRARSPRSVGTFELTPPAAG
jgi:predicted nicotinamide N-methyase